MKTEQGNAILKLEPENAYEPDAREPKPLAIKRAKIDRSLLHACRWSRTCKGIAALIEAYPSHKMACKRHDLSRNSLLFTRHDGRRAGRMLEMENMREQPHMIGRCFVWVPTAPVAKVVACRNPQIMNLTSYHKMKSFSFDLLDLIMSFQQAKLGTRPRIRFAIPFGQQLH